MPEKYASKVIKNAKLIFPKREIELAQDRNVFGRSDFEKDIPEKYLAYITGKDSSKYHFMITRQDGTYYIQDENSKNGTSLNDVEIRGKGSIELKNGDKIALAGIDNFIITFEISEAFNIEGAWEGNKIEYKTEIIKDHATRLVCAKLYEGGLLTASSILKNIKPKPFKAKNPEVGINIDLVAKHAENAYWYHLKFTLLAAGLTLLGIILWINAQQTSLSYDGTRLSGLLIAVTTFLIIWKSRYSDRKIVLDNFSKISYNPNYKIEKNFLERNLTQQEERTKQNVIIFGGYFPFLGAGKKIGNWNFVIDTTTPSKSFNVKFSKPEDINIDELYKSVAEDIRKKNLPNIAGEYILFADGKELNNSFLLPTRVGEPINNLDPHLLFKEGHKGLYDEFRTYYRIKYYDSIRATLFSTYLRFSEVGKEIFVECSFFALPPIDENIYDIDKLPLYDNLLGLKAGVWAIVFSIISFEFVMPGANPELVFVILSTITFGPLLIIFIGWFVEFIANWKLGRRIKKGETHNYGNFKTFRELIASPNYKNYFSAQDIIMIRDIIEKTMIYSIADLLQSKGIDSSFLREDLISFVNQGIMMYGGKLEAEQVAVGKGAIAMKPLMKGIESIKNIFGKRSI
jgi:hypothetical protein